MRDQKIPRGHVRLQVSVTVTGDVIVDVPCGEFDELDEEGRLDGGSLHPDDLGIDLVDWFNNSDRAEAEVFDVIDPRSKKPKRKKAA